MEGFATLDDLKAEAYESGSFYLGNCHPDHGASFPIGIKDDRHIFIDAGSRGGKGDTIIINNLIEWPHGVFCIDPKGENASITAMRRATLQAARNTSTSVTEHLGQEVAILDPLGCVRGPARALRVKYDPLSDINPQSVEAAGQILAIAESVVVSDGGDGAHFTDSAEIILAGVMELVVQTEPPKTRTMKTCRDLIIDGFGQLNDDDEPISGLMEKLQGIKTKTALAQEALSLLRDTGEDERGSFRSTLSRQLKWMADERMLDHLTGDGFSLRKIIRENGSVYVCIPPMFIPRMKRWLRSIVRVALDTKMEQNKPSRDGQTLFILDEFPALGHFQIIEDSAGYMAGYGIKLLPVIQNLGQLQKHYGKNYETFIGNAGAFIAWALNDHETEKYLSDRMGLRRSLEKSTGTTTGAILPIPTSRSKNWSMQDRPIRWPNEIRAQGARENMRGFVIPAKGAPFTIERVSYRNPSNEGKYDAESFIEQWESRYGDQIR